jgi:BirA family biotin operon repressor/biotin-[acetyl-CoA-carboxylase] ligase
MARPWHSAAGLGAYVSVMFRPTRPAAEATRWTLAAAVAACRACRELSRRPVVVKWPNDLLYEGRKLGGTLTELRSMGTQVAELIVGTGINVDHDVDDFPPEIRSSASSLRLISSQTGLQRELVVVAYLRQLELLAGQLEAGRWTGVAEAWLHLAPGAVDRPVQVVLHPGEPGSRSFRGTTRGLDEDGGLIVEGPNAERIVVHLGDSVRFLES